MTPLIPVEEAQRRLLSTLTPVPIEHVTLTEAIGRWAAADMPARRDQPAVDLSAMDGYAIRHADMPGPWRIVGESAAGRPFDGTVGPGEAARIFTGAAMPAGTDSVLIQEEAARDGQHLTLTGEGPPARGRNVRPRGLDFFAGDTLVSAGERLTPARLAVLAIGGHSQVPVRRRVRVAIAATGDELVAAGQPVTGTALPESNRLLLSAMLADLPVDIIDLGILPDELTVLRDAFAGVEADLLVTTGGASVGDHDLVRPALEAAGGTIDFWRVALRPGKPMMAGRIGAMPVLGLPGNPVSAFVTALLFVRPVIAALAGAGDPLPVPVTATLGEDLPANGARTDYLRATLQAGRVFASTIQDSSMLRTLARADCLVIRPAHAASARAGESAEILLLG
ncbi:Molybdopterin molybdochelatase [Sphingomonas sp. EC-HK361]|uniref:molybdopterin molybdotransferase MoeA n=1 Tax=Sphingomonas sp. EC-HK361 TaxID=2038397 RepID=UPI0012516C60|nr:gephyrin-like molybdotransferase Glp [Sphingomonas sp. EC-HK361]VVT07133.1 Molybdopterin molybdochelatase [Sphingomonas sp. EC-HK361]